ncbi:NUDIX domain-containing protein [Phyllobacterium salinisoli]|uniref:NUDIX domain-containing protein n=1 Tax=Phyllobacterium salinisoli TaxID=1899321 RepID=A0A368K425_9HYPH|nr:NUDIX domain-containing protein [Phyllobacterium salinisoli]RCS24138.1 NUDIX domain-containing protein [Phyllobacterium salinisoli]
MQRPGVGCGVVFLKDDSILLLQRKKSPEAGAWGIPGGKVDFLETVETAARREALEETGLDAISLSIIGTSEQLFHDEGQHWFAPIFHADQFAGEPKLLEPDKHGGIGWFRLTELPDRITLPTRHAVRLLFERGLRAPGVLLDAQRTS